jgi:hypothetical protein
MNTHLSHKLGAAKVTSRDDYNTRFMLQLGMTF